MMNYCASLTAILPMSSFNAAAPTVAGAVTLSRPVGLGQSNLPVDVASVQKLLNTAHQKINIPRNFITVDGQFGPETTAAINAFQDSQIGYHDTIVSPGKTTINRLNQIASGGAAFGSMKASALEVVGTAILWVAGAQMELASVNAASLQDPDDSTNQVIFKHFHFDRLKGSQDWYLNKVRTVFRLTMDVLVNADHYLQEGGGNGFADAPMGGYHFTNSPQFNHITIRKQFPPCGPNARAAMLVHECAHFVGFVNEIRHFAMEFPEPNGQPQDGSHHNYAQLTPDEAVLNASTYAAYAIHASTGQDSRFGLGKESI